MQHSMSIAPSVRSLEAGASCQSSPSVAPAEAGLERRGREAGGCGRQEHGERARGDGEAERRLEDDCLPVDAVATGPLEAHFELRRRPLAPAHECGDLSERAQRHELGGLRGVRNLHRDDPELAAVEPGPGAEAPRRSRR